MTNAELNEAVEGRKLDELVARKLGWKQSLIEPKCWSPPDTAGHLMDLALYSTSIEAAWEIVEYLLPDYVISIDTSLDRKEWHCLLMSDFEDKKGHSFKTIAATAPLAICLAFLKLP